MSSLRIAILGASGYTGAELVRLLSAHPRVELAGLYAQRHAGARLGQVFPHLLGLGALGARTLEAPDLDHVAERADLAVCALPHGHSAPVVAELHARGLRVIDLSADFRLRDPDDYARWYGSPERPAHPAPALLEEAAYGLPERYRDRIAGASLVACPGCYPTATLLAVGPLLERGLVAPEGLVVDAKSGVSGAGRSPSQATHFPEAGEGVRAYKIAGGHRHTAEIEQELGALAGRALTLIFTPHLVPMSRGILACVYAAPSDPGRDPEAYRQALVEAYADEPFVTVLEPGALPDTAAVRGSNHAHVQVAYDQRAQRVLALCAIDNLVKGASGQAVQCLNSMQGWDERAGLGAAPLFP
ncbi:N-acetyl-gamma-glutamyl-phosphate reductase [Haliangium sp.]|uniref:N-acetyl-gamma-glutamyl-phosphate reductase n=1 Tax=Haliangium sp. TaxID=2663208 RepID=UPI003D148FE8